MFFLSFDVSKQKKKASSFLSRFSAGTETSLCIKEVSFLGSNLSTVKEIKRNDSEQEKRNEIPSNTDYIKIRGKMTLHLSFQRSLLGFPGIPGSNGVPMSSGRSGATRTIGKGRCKGRN